MKATISTFSAFGQRISVDLRVEIDAAKTGQVNFLAVSRDISLELVRKNGAYELDWCEFGDVVLSLLIDLYTQANIHMYERLGNFLQKYIDDLAEMQRLYEYPSEYGAYTLALLANLNKKSVEL